MWYKIMNKLAPACSTVPVAVLPGLKPRFYLLLYDFFGPVSMTFYDQFMTF